MTLLDCLVTALQSLRTNVLRSILTALGIIIGVGAVISMVAVGAGAQARVDSLIQSIGANLLMVLPGSTTLGGARLGSGTVLSLTEDDALAMEREIGAVQVAAPSVRGSAQVIFGNANWFTTIQGVTNRYFEARDWTVARGRGFTEADLRGAKVALVGQSVVRELFAGADPIGETVRIARVPFEVVGVLGVKGQTPLGQDQDDVIFVPLETARQRVLGGRALGGRTVGTIAVRAVSGDLVGEAERQVTELLRQRHRIRPGQPDDFRIRNISELMATRAESSRVMTLLLAAVASVSLVVGGIGIMNIMLVSVTERTREIGLRMAVGARSRDILRQFLVEAVVLSLIGGIAGIALGVAGSLAIARLGDWPMALDPGAILLAFGFAAIVGIFFGYFPARLASRLDPIQALRYE